MIRMYNGFKTISFCGEITIVFLGSLQEIVLFSMIQFDWRRFFRIEVRTTDQFGAVNPQQLLHLDIAPQAPFGNPPCANKKIPGIPIK